MNEITLEFEAIKQIKICEIQLFSSESFNCGSNSPYTPLNGELMKTFSSDDEESVAKKITISQVIAQNYRVLTGQELELKNNLVFYDVYSCKEGYDKYRRSDNGRIVKHDIKDPHDIYLCGPEGTFIGRQYMCKPKALCPMFDIIQLNKNRIALKNGDLSDIEYLHLSDYNANYHNLTYFSAKLIAQIGTEVEFQCFSEFESSPTSFPKTSRDFEWLNEINIILTDNLPVKSELDFKYISEQISEIKALAGKGVVTTYQLNALLNDKVHMGVFRFGKVNPSDLTLHGNAKLVCTKSGWRGQFPKCVATPGTHPTILITGYVFAGIILFAIALASVLLLRFFYRRAVDGVNGTPLYRPPFPLPGQMESFNGLDDENYYSVAFSASNEDTNAYIAKYMTVMNEEPYDDCV